MKLDLSQGAYQARSVLANAQECLNLFGENNPPDSPWKVTHYPTPGLDVVADFSASQTGWMRGLYWASDRNLYAVSGTTVFRVLPGWIEQFIGDLGANSGNPISMVDNGITLVIVDGSANGWTVDLATLAFAPIADPAFYGSNRVDFIDTFLIFHWPLTQTFYISDSNAVTFNPLYFAEKIGYNDVLVSLAALHDNIWLLGRVTSEVWFNSGAAAFPFERMPNTIIQQGCIAPYSVVVADNAVYWLSQDRLGRNMLMRGEGYTAKRVSNFAIEDAWSRYPFVSDAIGMAYNEGGHEFIVMDFPTAGATWVHDATTSFWHRRAFTPAPNLTGAWLPACMAYWNDGSGTNMVVAGDRSTPRLFVIDRTNTTDAGTPIRRVRAWPHVINDQKRLSHTQFVAAMQGTNLAPDAVSLRWSDDGGQTFGTPVVQTTSNASNGQYSWRRLGYARDRVYELSWTAQGETALNGAWLEAVPAET